MLNPALSTHGNYPGIGLEGAKVWDADSQGEPWQALGSELSPVALEEAQLEAMLQPGSFQLSPNVSIPPRQIARCILAEFLERGGRVKGLSSALILPCQQTQGKIHYGKQGSDLVQK